MHVKMCVAHLLEFLNFYAMIFHRKLVIILSNFGLAQANCDIKADIARYTGHPSWSAYCFGIYGRPPSVVRAVTK